VNRFAGEFAGIRRLAIQYEKRCPYRKPKTAD
jgi:hypothetical protein